MRCRRTTCIGLLLLSLTLCGGAWAAAPIPDRVELRVGESQQLEIPGLTRFAVDDAKVVQAVKVRPEVLQLTGQKDGITLLRAFSEKGSYKVICVVGAAESAKGDGGSGKAADSRPPAGDSTPDNEAFLQPGDVIALNVFGEDAFNKTYQVDDDGDVTIPLLDKVRVAGLTPTQVKEKLTKALAKYLVDPEVKVRVAERTQRPLGHVTIVGQVEKPGSIPVRRGEQRRVFEWLLEVKLLPSADLSRVQLTRETVSKEPRLLNIQQLVEEGNGADNIVVLPGDTLFVPELPKVTVLGAVQQPGPMQVPDGLTLIEVITQAGGALRQADLSRVEITRARGPQITVNLYEAMQRGNTLQNPLIQPGDSVFVPILKGIRVIGQVQKPGVVYTSEEKVSVVTALQEVGGFMPNADLAKSQVIRETNDVVSIDLESILKGEQPSIDLQPGDTLFVPIGTEVSAVSSSAGPPKVTIFGEVQKRGIIPLTGRITLLELLQDVGAIGNSGADLENVEVAFKDGTNKTVNVDKLLREADDEENVELRGGERIYVPKASPLKNAIYVTGGVARPGIYKYESGMTMFQGILQAGGVARYSKKEVSIMRMNPATNQQEQLEFDLQKIKEGGQAEDPLLQPGDVVYVGEGKPPFNWRNALGTATQFGWLLWMLGR